MSVSERRLIPADPMPGVVRQERRKITREQRNEGSADGRFGPDR